VSSRTIVYKGLLLAARFATMICAIPIASAHLVWCTSVFSNTFPNGNLHPFPFSRQWRNGTVRGSELDECPPPNDDWKQPARLISTNGRSFPAFG
jgi:hypothetical protein